jgi:hypothetical protein
VLVFSHVQYKVAPTASIVGGNRSMIVGHIMYVTTYFFDELTVHEKMVNRFFSVVAHMIDISQLPLSSF